MPKIHTHPKANAIYTNYHFLNEILPEDKTINGVSIFGWDFEIGEYTTISVDLSQIETRLKDFNEWGIDIVKKIEARTGQEVQVYLT